jgi:serine/threonine protein kinase
MAAKCEYVITDKLLGEGSYAKVYEGINKKTKKEVAVKVMSFRTDVDLMDVDASFHITHPSIASSEKILTHDECLSSTKVGMVSEKAIDNLYNIIFKKKVKFDKPTIINMLWDLADGMYFMHSNNVLNLDIKSENVLFYKNNKVKISDFGLVIYQNSSLPSTRNRVTPTYAPPEMLKIKDEFVFNDKVDVWSLGVVFIEILLQKYPFSYDGKLTYKPINYKKIQTDYGTDAVKLIKGMLTKSPTTRFSMKDVINSPVFSGKTLSVGVINHPKIYPPRLETPVLWKNVLELALKVGNPKKKIVRKTKVADLKILAKSKKIKGYSKMKKNELLRAVYLDSNDSLYNCPVKLYFRLMDLFFLTVPLIKSSVYNKIVLSGGIAENRPSPVTLEVSPEQYVTSLVILAAQLEDLDELYQEINNNEIHSRIITFILKMFDGILYRASLFEQSKSLSFLRKAEISIKNRDHYMKMVKKGGDKVFLSSSKEITYGEYIG